MMRITSGNYADSWSLPVSKINSRGGGGGDTNIHDNLQWDSHVENKSHPNSNLNCQVRANLLAPLVTRNQIRERVTGVDMIQVLLMLFCYFTYKIIT